MQLPVRAAPLRSAVGGKLAGTVKATRQSATAARSMAKNSTAKLFSFGVVSDVQYADIPDGVSFHGTPRCVAVSAALYLFSVCLV